MNKGLKKAAAFGLCAALAMTSLAGCSKKEEVFDGTQTAVTVNGTEISVGVVKFATHYMQAATEDLYNEYFGAGAMNMAIDDAGTTLGAMMKDQGVSSLIEMVLAEQHMEEYGVALTEDDKTAIADAAAAFIAENDEEVLEKMGAAQADVERYLELQTIRVKMDPAMGADVDTEVSDEEAAQRKIQYTLVSAESPETEEGETEGETEAETESPEAMADAYAKAEELIALIKSGEEFEAAAQSIDAELSVHETSFDPEDTVVAEALVTATNDLADDTLVETPVEGSAGYYVVKLITQLDREATDAKKEEIVEQRRTDLVDGLYAEWSEAAEINKDDKVLAKIVFDFSLTLETEAATEAVTEAAEEAATEAVTETEEAAAEAVTEAEEAAAEAVTETEEAATEAVTEAEEAAAEAVTEAAAEAVTEAATE